MDNEISRHRIIDNVSVLFDKNANIASFFRCYNLFSFFRGKSVTLTNPLKSLI